METEVKWCTYSAFGKTLPRSIGQLVKQEGNTGKIKYAENQMYSLEYWDMSYVAVFDTIEEAIIYMITNNHDESVRNIREWLAFRTTMNEIDWDELSKLEDKILHERKRKN